MRSTGLTPPLLRLIDGADAILRNAEHLDGLDRDRLVDALMLVDRIVDRLRRKAGDAFVPASLPTALHDPVTHT